VGYLEDIAAMRQEREQREYVEKFQEVQANHQSNFEMREQAARDGDRESWHYWDKEFVQSERDLQAFMPVQQPQVDPRAARWDLINRTYIDRLVQRHGVQGANQKLAQLDGYLTRPRIPNEPNLDRKGMGLQRNSPAYLRNAETLLELYSQDATGVKYDPGEKALTPDDAAKISCLSPRSYNRSVQTLMNAGRVRRED
jgi:hypothetical protein